MTNRTIFTLRAQNYGRYFLLFFLLVLAIFASTLFNYLPFLSVYILCLISAAAISIRFPKILIFENFFRIERKSIIRNFSSSVDYEFSKLKKVKFQNGRADWKGYFFKNFYSRTDPDVDQMIIEKLNGTKISILRIGSSENFRNAITIINDRIMPSN